MVTTPQQNSWQFHVTGTPGPKGSKTLTRWGALRESSAKVRPWQDAVTAAIWEQTRGNAQHTLTGPVGVAIQFFLQPPKRVPKNRRLPVTKPDIDKLVRATFDALTQSGLIKDDALITDQTATKRYTDNYNQQPGALIHVWSIGD
jgi:Holliday junction resolvase RusA-like endonuclease